MPLTVWCLADVLLLAFGVPLVWKVWLNGWFAEDCLCCGGPLFRSLLPAAWPLTLAVFGLLLFGARYWVLGLQGRYGAWMQWPYAVILMALACAPLTCVCLVFFIVLLVVAEALPPAAQQVFGGLSPARLSGLMWGIIFALLAGGVWLWRRKSGAGEGRRSRLGWVALAFALWMVCFGVPDLVTFERWRVTLG